MELLYHKNMSGMIHIQQILYLVTSLKKLSNFFLLYDDTLDINTPLVRTGTLPHLRGLKPLETRGIKPWQKRMLLDATAHAHALVGQYAATSPETAIRLGGKELDVLDIGSPATKLGKLLSAGHRKAQHRIVPIHLLQALGTGRTNSGHQLQIRVDSHGQVYSEGNALDISALHAIALRDDNTSSGEGTTPSTSLRELHTNTITSGIFYKGQLTSLENFLKIGKRKAMLPSFFIEPNLEILVSLFSTIFMNIGTISDTSLAMIIGISIALFIFRTAFSPLALAVLNQNALQTRIAEQIIASGSYLHFGYDRLDHTVILGTMNENRAPVNIAAWHNIIMQQARSLTKAPNDRHLASRAKDFRNALKAALQVSIIDQNGKIHVHNLLPMLNKDLFLGLKRNSYGYLYMMKILVELEIVSQSAVHDLNLRKIFNKAMYENLIGDTEKELLLWLAQMGHPGVIDYLTELYHGGPSSSGVVLTYLQDNGIADAERVIAAARIAELDAQFGPGRADLDSPVWQALEAASSLTTSPAPQPEQVQVEVEEPETVEVP